MIATHRNSTNPRCPAALLALVLVAVSLLGGCGAVEEAKLSDYLDEVEFDNQLESLKEVSLGKFKVSAATKSQEAKRDDTERLWVTINCKLFVIVAPEDESAVSSAYEQHRGVFDDMVVQVFRSSSIEELSDPRWATIKSRIADAARPILGGERVRQIIIDDFSWQPI